MNILRILILNNKITTSDRKFAALNYEQYVSVCIHVRFDRFFRNNRDLYDVLNKDTGAKVFSDYLLCFTDDPVQYNWSINKELWADNDMDISINADEKQRALGNIHAYRIFEPILKNEKLLHTLYNRAVTALPSTYAEDLLIGYEKLEWKLDYIVKAHLTGIKDMEWRRMLVKYYYDFLEIFRQVRNLKESLKISGIDTTLLLDILLQSATLGIKPFGRELLIADIINSTYKTVENDRYRLKNENTGDANEERLKDIARKLKEDKFGDGLMEIYRRSDYPQSKKKKSTDSQTED
ncbi:hypothetical protein [Alistipes sp.]|uniref:hypothetical protein n=1 Tax=Alistipes sp. TaxID=1872444 RepID=UPI003AB216DA